MLSRRIWFLYEWLIGRTLDLPDAPNVAAIDILDSKAYFTAKPRLSRRHRVRDNLLGTARFCPVIRRTESLTDFASLALAEKARETVGRSAGHLVHRAASFLRLADSRASFELEGERPPRNRLERWGRAIMQAGRTKLMLVCPPLAGWKWPPAPLPHPPRAGRAEVYSAGHNLSGFLGHA